MSGVSIKIKEIGGSQKIYNSVTDNEGNYELIVPEGKYKVTPTIPTYAELGLFSDDPIIVKDRSCSESSFTVQNKSLISGKVIDSQGKPVKEIRLEVISTDSARKPRYGGDDGGLTDEKGNFSIENIPSGSYTLSVNYLASPDEENPFPTVF